MASRLEVKDYLPMTRKRVLHSRIGNCEGFFFTNLGKPLLLLGPQCNINVGPYFIAYSLSTTAFVILFLIASSHLMNSTVQVLTWTSGVMFILLTFYSGIVNPGIEIQIGIKQQEILKYFSDRKFCRVCEVIRDEGCLHCVECDLCVNKRSAHSSILGKCIGKGNYYSYYLSILALGVTAGSILLSIFMTIVA